jgi:hypothetical protein
VVVCEKGEMAPIEQQISQSHIFTTKNRFLMKIPGFTNVSNGNIEPFGSKITVNSVLLQ